MTYKEFALPEVPGPSMAAGSSPAGSCFSSGWGYDFFGGTRTVQDVHVRTVAGKAGPRARVADRHGPQRGYKGVRRRVAGRGGIPTPRLIVLTSYRGLVDTSVSCRIEGSALVPNGRASSCALTSSAAGSLGVSGNRMRMMSLNNSRVPSIWCRSDCGREISRRSLCPLSTKLSPSVTVAPFSFDPRSQKGIDFLQSPKKRTCFTL